MLIVFTLGEMSKIVKRSPKTLQRWDREGVLKAERTPTNRRFYTQDQVNSYFGVCKTEERRVIVYCRVSSHNQKPDLKNQTSILEEYCLLKGITNFELVKEIGGGLNFKRKKFLRILDEIESGLVKELIVAHKDRLTRFGFDLVEQRCFKNNCKITVLNQEKLSPEQEMVQDLMSIIHCFSSRLYGLRNYRKDLKKALDQNDQFSS